VISDPQDPGFPVPTSADATWMLQEISPVTRRSRRLARDATVARPLLAWGVAWLAGAVMYQFGPVPLGAILGSAASVGAAGFTWLVRSRDVRLQSERRFALMWVVLFATSALLVAVVQPANGHVLAVFLASLWAVGMLMYGVGVRDIPLAAIGLATLVVAAAGRLFAPGAAVLAVGIAGGVGMAALGAWRMRWKRGG
jgi:hypothetical protein